MQIPAHLMQHLRAQSEGVSEITVIADNCTGHQVKQQNARIRKSASSSRHRRRKPRRISAFKSKSFPCPHDGFSSIPSLYDEDIGKLATARWGDDEETTDDEREANMRMTMLSAASSDRWKSTTSTISDSSCSTSSASSLDSMVSLKSIVIARGQSLAQRRKQENGSRALVLPKRLPDHHETTSVTKTATDKTTELRHASLPDVLTVATLEL